MTAPRLSPREEVIARAQADLTLLAPLGTHIQTINFGLSDPHLGNRQVARVTLTDGNSWFLKPRSLSAEACFDQFVSTLRGDAWDPPLYRIIERPSYGWMSAVCDVDSADGEKSLPSDAQDYWRLTGVVVAALHLLGVTDIHTENIIWTSSGPVPVDVECIAQPLLGVRSDLLGTDGPGAVGILPGTVNCYQPVWRDMSALHVEALPSTAPPLRTAAMIQGYRAALGRAQRCRHLVHRLEQIGARVLLRQTGSYQPFVGKAASTWAEAAPPLAQSLVGSLGPDAVQRLISAEARSLASGDIPLAVAVGRSLYISNGEELLWLGDAITRNPTQGVMHRMDASTEQPVVDAWCAVIEQSLVQDGWPDPRMARQPPRGDDRTPVRTGALGVRRSIDALASMAVEPSSMGWPTAAPAGLTTRLQLELGQPGLLDGAAGIAFVLALAAQRLDDCDLARLAISSLPEIDAAAAVAGYGTGQAGIAWATVAIGSLLEEQSLLDKATSWLIEKAPRSISSRRFDLVDGWSGLTAVAAVIAQLGRAGAANDRAVLITRSLCQAIDSSDPAALAPSLRRAGMAHGLSGIAVALTISGSLLRMDDAIYLGQRLLEREDAQLPRCLNEGPSMSWFGGAAGWLIARERIQKETCVRSPVLDELAVAVRRAQCRDGTLGFGEIGRGLAVARHDRSASERSPVLPDETRRGSSLGQLGSPSADFTVGLAGACMLRGAAGVALGELLNTAAGHTPDPLTIL